MKIISKFKDYYDHIAHVYGVDEKIAYPRDRISNTSIELQKPFSHQHLLRDLTNRSAFSVHAIVVVDRIFFVTHKFDSDVLIPEDELSNSTSRMLFLLRREEESYQNDSILQLTKKVGHPVYRIVAIEGTYNRKAIVFIDKEVPILKNIRGLPAELSAEQAYQEISYAIVNTINQSPDSNPPVEVSDKYKIIAAGFDKQSFRHRK